MCFTICICLHGSIPDGLVRRAVPESKEKDACDLDHPLTCVLTLERCMDFKLPSFSLYNEWLIVTESVVCDIDWQKWSVCLLIASFNKVTIKLSCNVLCVVNAARTQKKVEVTRVELLSFIGRKWMDLHLFLYVPMDFHNLEPYFMRIVFGPKKKNATNTLF